MDAVNDSHERKSLSELEQLRNEWFLRLGETEHWLIMNPGNEEYMTYHRDKLYFNEKIIQITNKINSQLTPTPQ